MPAWPDGETLVIPIVGDPVAQVGSPAGLSAAIRTRGVNAVVVPAHVAPDDLAAYLAGFRVARNSPALIVTVPHKAAILAVCDRMTDRARLAGSVNVVRKTARGWIGDNTDGTALLDAIAAAGRSADAARVLLVGAGGAGSAIAVEGLARGAALLAVHDTGSARRDALIARLAAAYPGRLAAGSMDPASTSSSTQRRSGCTPVTRCRSTPHALRPPSSPPVSSPDQRSRPSSSPRAAAAALP